jgi:type I restriction enzyme S subunit
MIADLKPYPAMKDSGVEWLGEVPEHWDLPRTKTVLRERSEKGYPDEPLLAATQTKGVVRKDQYGNRTVVAMKDLHLLKLVEVDDFVISLRSFQGGIESARVRGIISPAYTVLYPADSPFQGYLAKLFKSSPYIENLGLYVTGIRQGQNIDYEKLSRSRLPLPPLPEQAAIVRYIDHVDRRVRRLVRAKRKLIALLTEQKQAIIHRAVTRGLDPDVPLKDSGVEWLGEVPEHWEVRRNGRLFAQRNETGFADLPILEVSLRTGIRIRDFENSVRKQVMSDRDKYKRARTGDIAYNTMRMWQGAVGIAPTDGLISPAYVIARPLPGTVSRYFEMLFRTSVYMQEVDNYSRGIVKDRNRLYWEDFKAMPSCYPPPSEQSAIVDHLDQATADIDTTITRAEREIELLNEYRTRLIADVVTGKLDVRDAAAALPEVDPLAEDDNADDLDLDADELDEAPEEAEA